MSGGLKFEHQITSKNPNPFEKYCKARAPPEEMAITIEIRSHCSFDAYWVRTWVVLEHEKQYCEWDTKDAEPIRKVFEKVPEIAATVEAIYQMEIRDAEEFR